MLLKMKKEKKIGEKERYPLLEQCNILHKNGINTKGVGEIEFFNMDFVMKINLKQTDADS